MNALVSPDPSAAALLGIASASHSEILVSGDAFDPSGAVRLAPQPFESEILGFPVVRIDRLAVADGAAEGYDTLVQGCLEILRRRGIALVTCRLPENEAATIAALERAGFIAIERLLTFRTECLLGEPLAGVHLATPEDAEACAAIAGSVFTHNRFHVDPNIDNGTADALKAAWARNSCRGRADAVLVTRDATGVTGFNACVLGGRTAVIDLIAVARRAQGRGLGKVLVRGALAHYFGRADEMIVGTQDGNEASMALYESCGFRQRDATVTLHLHL